MLLPASVKLPKKNRGLHYP